MSTTPNPFEQLRARHRPEAKEVLQQHPEIRTKLVTPESEPTLMQDGHGHDGSTGTKWPAPLAPQAFHGIAGEIVYAIEPHTEADPAALLIQFLAGFGNLVGRGAYTTVEADRHWCNLFAAIVGVSAKGRKGTSWGHIRRVLDNVETVWANGRIQGGLSSGEGLVWAVRDPTEKQEAVREGKEIRGYQTIQVDGGVSDKRLVHT